MAYKVDFKEIKERIKIEDCAAWLQLEFRVGGLNLRGPCPTCQTGGDRALVVTPGKGYYCFAAKAGGDVIALAAHVLDCTQKEAAERLATEFRVGGTCNTVPTVPDRSPSPHQPRREGFDAEAYGAALDPNHEAVGAVGFTSEVATTLGLGYCSKGLLAGFVALPLRLPDGTIAGFVGIQEAKLPSKWNLEQKVVQFPRKSA